MPVMEEKGPNRPARGCGDDLHVAAVLARPPQVHSALGPIGPHGRTRTTNPVSADQDAIHRHVRMARGAGGQQCAMQLRRGGSQGVDASCRYR